MKLSVMLFPFHTDLKEGTYTPAQLIERFYSVGIRAIEPMLSNIKDAPDIWEELWAAARDLGMVCSCVDVGANFIGESEQDREDAMATVIGGIELCKQLDCPVALLPGTRPAEGMSNEEGRRIYARMLARAAQETADLGVTLSIEDFGVTPHFTCHSSHVLEVVQMAGPELKVTWDSGNFMLADEMPVDAWEPLRARTVHVHIKDWQPAPADSDAGIRTPSARRWVGTQIGQGHGQVRECLELIHAADYDGWISLEVGVRPALEAAVIGAKCCLGVWESLGN